MQTFDIIVIGAGSGGLTSAIGLAKAGKKVALIERGLMGGDCTNFGCIPSKTLIHLAREHNIGAPQEERAKEILELVRRKVLSIRDEESPDILKTYGITVFQGEAVFTGKKTLEVHNKDTLKKKDLTAKNIIIATGARARLVSIPGADPKSIYTHVDIFDLVTAPKHLLVIGGGPIGCELGLAFHHLGTKVTIVSHGKHLLGREEASIMESTETEFRKKGITVFTEAEVTSIQGNKAQISVKKAANTTETTEKSEVTVESILVSIGRIPNTESLNLEKADIRTQEGRIIISQHYRTSNPHVYAVGDVAAKMQFTHVADDMARHVIQKIVLPLTTSRAKPVPRVTYLDREIASIGLTSEEAEKRFGKDVVHTISIDLSSIDRAKTDNLDGEVRIIVKKLSGKILGASIHGRGAGEMISVITLSMQQNISLWKLGSIIFPYPVLSLAFKKAADQFLVYTLKNYKADLWRSFRKHAPKICSGLLWLILLVSYFTYQISSGQSSLDIAKILFTFLSQSFFGPLLFIFLYIIRPLVLFPATPLTVIAGILFGPWLGTLYTVIAENASASFAYAIGRYFGKSLIPEGSHGFLSRLKDRLKTGGFLPILFTRLLYFPFDVVNYGAGFLKVDFKEFFLATCIGTIPGLLTFVLLGASFEGIGSFDPSEISFNPYTFGSALLILVVSLFIAWIMKRIDNSRQ